MPANIGAVIAIIPRFLSFFPSGRIAFSDVVFQHCIAPISTIANVSTIFFSRVDNALFFRGTHAKFFFEIRQFLPLVIAANIGRILVFDLLVKFGAIAKAHMVRHHGTAPAIRVANVFHPFYHRILTHSQGIEGAKQIATAIAELFFEIGKWTPFAIFACVAFPVEQERRRIVFIGARFARIVDASHLPSVVLADIHRVVDGHRRFGKDMVAVVAKVVFPAASKAAVVALFAHHIEGFQRILANGIAQRQILLGRNDVGVGHATQLIIAKLQRILKCRQRGARSKYRNPVRSQVLTQHIQILAIQGFRFVDAIAAIGQLQCC